MCAAKYRPLRRRSRESARNVAEAVPRCQLRLGLRMSHAGKHIRPHGDIPQRCERARAARDSDCSRAREAVAPTAGPARAPRVRRARPPARSVAPCATRARRRRGANPVLERVHGAESDGARRPAGASRRANVRRQERAPPTLLTVRRVSAAFTVRRREQRQSRPASAADHAALVAIEDALADRAHPRQHEVDERFEVRDERARRLVASSMALHITARSGATPNQRSNASAPCSTSIARPSAARWPCARAPRTSAVSPGRYTRSKTALSGASMRGSTGVELSCSPTDVALTTSSHPSITPMSSAACATVPNRSQSNRARSGVRL